jgi:hypothetical protein
MTDGILILALAFAALIFWRLHRRLGVPATAASADDIGAPAGAGALPLGQYAVAADRQWLLIKPGS